MQLSLLKDFEIEQSEISSDNWYTPAWLIDLAREVMGWIDTDPASCLKANAIIKASTFYTKQHDGLIEDWQGRVWLNPPYSMPLIEQFTARLCETYFSGSVTAACVLTRNATETKWCQLLLTNCDCFCLLNKRVSFWHPDKPVGTDKCGHILFYFGGNTEAFYRLLNPHGLVFKGHKL